MKVGDYVRTKYEGIVKCYSEVFYEPSVDIGIAVYPEIEGIWVDKEHTNYIETKDIIKSSPNIIDLIEVGDYVNGLPVEEVLLNDGIYIHRADDKYDRDIYIVQEDIKSILTHEQFKNWEYKIGE